MLVQKSELSVIIYSETVIQRTLPFLIHCLQLQVNFDVSQHSGRKFGLSNELVLDSSTNMKVFLLCLTLIPRIRFAGGRLFGSSWKQTVKIKFISTGSELHLTYPYSWDGYLFFSVLSKVVPHDQISAAFVCGDFP